MAGKNRVLDSFNAHGESRCVDIFLRPDGSFGFEEYRRDAEDARGWFAVGGFAGRVFASREDALAQARRTVAWLDDHLP